jgi:ribonuclease J
LCSSQNIFKGGRIVTTMGIEICAVGGYGEVGKNMTAIKIDDEVILFDMGIHLPNYISYTQDDQHDIFHKDSNELIDVEAVPNPKTIADWQSKVVAIIPTHAHLDHIGAIPYIADRFDAPVYCTPFTKYVILNILKDERIKIPNEIIEVAVNSKIKITDKLTVEFLNMTHSTPHTAMCVLHTPYGSVLYGNDFKLDDQPTLGKKPNYARLKAMGEKGIVKVAIIDTLYADSPSKAGSESVAKQMLKDTLLCSDFDGAVLVTTFSSHIARIKSAADLAQKMGRIPIAMGRSLAKYLDAARDAGIYEFPGPIIKYGRQRHRKFKELNRNKKDYVILVTGHQGEPNAVLSKICDKQLPFFLERDDAVVFSCNVIPVEPNIENRVVLESKLKRLKVRMFKGVHVSGHGAKEDLRELLKMCKPKHVIPAHSEQHCMDDFADLARELGYKKNKTLHMIYNKDRLTLK